MTTVEILRKARDHIAQPGAWCQGMFRRSDGKCCALGAIAKVIGGLDCGYSEARRALMNALPNPRRSVADFNDAPGRTQSEVVALFDRAIELAEREPTP